MKYLNNDDKYDLSGTQYGQALTYIKKYSWLIISDWNINGPILGSGLHIQNKNLQWGFIKTLRMLCYVIESIYTAISSKNYIAYLADGVRL